jgi:hypothetical protein
MRPWLGGLVVFALLVLAVLGAFTLAQCWFSGGYWSTGLACWRMG